MSKVLKMFFFFEEWGIHLSQGFLDTYGYSMSQSGYFKLERGEWSILIVMEANPEKELALKEIDRLRQQANASRFALYAEKLPIGVTRNAAKHRQILFDDMHTSNSGRLKLTYTDVPLHNCFFFFLHIKTTLK